MIIYWHKHDFRLFDNPALAAAVALAKSQNSAFVPILGLETDLIKDPKTGFEYADFHQFGYLSSLLPLYQNYLHFGAHPILFESSVLETLENLHSLNKISHLVSHQEHGTTGTWNRDKIIGNFCKKHNIEWLEIRPSGVKRGLANRDDHGHIFRQYINSPLIPIPTFEVDPNNTDVVHNLKHIFTTQNDEIFAQFSQRHTAIHKKYILPKTSEKVGLETLKSFVKTRSKYYRGGISSPNSALLYGSRLSQFLAFGSLSLRFVYQSFWQEIKVSSDSKTKAGILGALQRLHWREHFIQRLETEASMSHTAINQNFNQIIYSHDLELFEKFKTGNTGEVLIDACIRCLLQTGFINFRMRAMLVSYAIFGLDLDWRQVGRFLASVFLDYEPGIHWSQIQMQSGITGINTIRVYSPQKQLLDQDPECVFVKKWLPELTDIEPEIIKKYTTISLFKITKGAYCESVVDFKSACKINKLKTFGVRKTADPNVNQAVYLKHGSRKKKIPKFKAKTNSKPQTQSSDPLL